MASFTPQQLSGQKGYRHRTFIGNWNEDVQYEEDAMREYLMRRERGELLSQKVTGKMKCHQAAAALHPLRPDGWVHFGDLIMLQNAATGGCLSVDLDDQISARPEAKYGVTTCAVPGPQRRNSWMCVRIPCADDDYWDSKGEGEVLHYGQKFKLQLNPDLTEGRRPLRLFSEKRTPTCFSKVSKAQEVSAADYGTMNTNWQVLFANPEFRFEMEGQPVKANCVIVLAHCNTGQFLSSERKGYPNDFGTEWEVCAQKVHGMRAKHKDAPEEPCNRWAMVSGLASEEDNDTQAAAADGAGSPATEEQQ
eukprot:TRINITY_DN21507_c0_g1_i1.p1 TRINITY_DN21507_c0_g1~~TRINITY_DN21507_c0_g1_i1.p1  ORF type:complete len:341 (+),score=128.86 TRINITY_DN21507_c0_g1_i1:106-1023(+)